MFDYIIVGAGFAGIVMAERIANVLNKKVLIIEKRNHIGGNCYDEKLNNILIHKYGPHLFHTDNKEVWDYLSRFTEWEVYNHKVLSFVDGENVPIPFNLNSLYKLFPLELSRKLEKELITNFDYGSRIPILELKQTDKEELKFLADFIYEKFFVNYTAKQWGKKPEEIDKEVTSRVPISISKDNRYFNDKYQAVPKNGYSALFQKMISHENIKLLLNCNFNEVISLDHESKKIYFFNQEFNGKLIYTGMIDELFDYHYGELPYRSVKMKFETIKKEYYQEATTINYPNSYDFTRITEFKHIHPINIEHTVILKEYPTKYIKNKNTPYYPIFTEENRDKYNKYLEYSKDFKSILLVGRLAEYKYYDMDDIVKRSLDIFNMRLSK